MSPPRRSGPAGNGAAEVETAARQDRRDQGTAEVGHGAAVGLRDHVRRPTLDEMLGLAPEPDPPDPDDPGPETDPEVEAYRRALAEEAYEERLRDEGWPDRWEEYRLGGLREAEEEALRWYRDGWQRGPREVPGPRDFDAEPAPPSAMLTAALEYSANGWEVFPLAGKVPLISRRDGGRGVLDATGDADVITRWWTNWRDANIGGRIPEALVMLDTDPRHGGEANLQRLASEHGGLTATLTSASGRGDGGLHRWFLHPGGTVSAARLPPGVDLKVSTGYAVLPPSVHPDSGMPYRWVDLTGPTALQPWLAELLRPARPAAREAARRERGGSTRPRVHGDPDRRLDGLCRRVSEAAEGERNDVLFWAACRAAELVAEGADAVHVGDALADAARACGLAEGEIAGTLRSGLGSEVAA